jgi:hypothetical protein
MTIQLTSKKTYGISENRQMRLNEMTDICLDDQVYQLKMSNGIVLLVKQELLDSVDGDYKRLLK